MTNFLHQIIFPYLAGMITMAVFLAILSGIVDGADSGGLVMGGFLAVVVVLIIVGINFFV